MLTGPSHEMESFEYWLLRLYPVTFRNFAGVLWLNLGQLTLGVTNLEPSTINVCNYPGLNCISWLKEQNWCAPVDRHSEKKKRKKYKYSCARKKSNSHQKLLNNLKLSMVGNVGVTKNQFAHDHATVVPIIYYTQVGLSFGNYDENV